MIEGSVQPLARVMNPFDVKVSRERFTRLASVDEAGAIRLAVEPAPRETAQPLVAGRFADVAAVLVAAREDYGIAPPGLFGGGARCTVR